MAGVGGTIAEAAFEDLYPHKWLRMGFDRPNWSDGVAVGYQLPKILTAMPDYLARNGSPYWVEAKGCKGNLIRSVKVVQFDHLVDWQGFTQLDVHVFVWNSTKKAWLSISLERLGLITMASPIKEFHDGPEYYELDWNWVHDQAQWKGRR